LQFHEDRILIRTNVFIAFTEMVFSTHCHIISAFSFG